MTSSDHALFAGNTSKLAGSAASLGTKTRITSSTLAANRSEVDGSLVAYDSAQLELRDLVIWDELSPGGHAISLPSSSARLGVDHCDVEGGIAGLALHPDATLQWGDGNLDLDPLFVDADGADDDPLTLLDNDWRLGPGSPCVDAGDDAALAADGADQDGDGDLAEPVPFDLDGLPRQVDDPAAPDTGAGRAPLVDIGSYERQG